MGTLWVPLHSDVSHNMLYIIFHLEQMLHLFLSDHICSWFTSILIHWTWPFLHSTACCCMETMCVFVHALYVPIVMDVWLIWWTFWPLMAKKISRPIHLWVSPFSEGMPKRQWICFRWNQWSWMSMYTLGYPIRLYDAIIVMNMHGG